jgi:hypothetical protein
MSHLLRQKVIALLKECECEKEITEHHLKLADKPKEAGDVKVRYKGNEFIGWCEKKNDKCTVVLFHDAGDGTDHYVEEDCENNKDDVEACIKQAVKKLSSYLD